MNAFRYVGRMDFASGLDHDEDSDTPEESDHAMVDLSWCVPVSKTHR